MSDQGYFVIGEVEVLIKYPNPTPEQALDAVIDWAHEFLVSPAREGVESELIDFSSVTATVKHGRIDEVTFYIPDTDARVVMVRKGSTSVGLGDDTYPIYQFDIRQY